MKSRTRKIVFAGAAALASAAVIGLFVVLPLSVYGPLTGEPHLQANGQWPATAHPTGKPASTTAAMVALPKHTILVFLISGWAAVGVIILIGSLLLHDRHKEFQSPRPMPRISNSKGIDELMDEVTPFRSVPALESHSGTERRFRTEGRRTSDRNASVRAPAEDRRANDRGASLPALVAG